MALFWKVQVGWVTEIFNKRQHDPLQFEDFNVPFQEDSRLLLLQVFRRLSKKVYHVLNITNLGLVLVF